MMEVGRQGGIFAGFRDAYVWLNLGNYANILPAVLKIGYELTQEGRDVRDALKPLLCAFEAIFQDPWFSLLWCLKESVLQRSAVFIDRDGDIVTAPGPWYPHSFATQVSLVDTPVTCSMVHNTLGPEFNGRPAAWTSTDPSSGDLEKWHRLLKFLEEASMDFGICSNHNVQYGAARFRQTTRNEDRIYAIMQIYGFQLGELELQFLRSLHNHQSWHRHFCISTDPLAGRVGVSLHAQPYRFICGCFSPSDLSTMVFIMVVRYQSILSTWPHLWAKHAQ
jgi:hypothetical protein